jgi:hypothetical protein
MAPTLKSSTLSNVQGSFPQSYLVHGKEPVDVPSRLFKLLVINCSFDSLLAKFQILKILNSLLTLRDSGLWGNCVFIVNVSIA